jgi:pimeloyl-ACP methyl ester carboxylesterase
MKHWRRSGVRGVCCVLAVGAACLPAPTVEQLVLADDDDTLVLLVHGAGPNEDPTVWADATAADITTALIEDRRGAGVAVHAWDWSARSASRELATSAAGDEGRAIANVVADSAVQHVHIVAHSLGAQVAISLLEALNEDGSVTTHATLLDPFSLFGELDCSGATVCESWRNSDDGAPGSDVPLETAYNRDVTSARPAAWLERGHWWPTEAWRHTISARNQPGFSASLEAGVDLGTLGRMLTRGGGS